MDGNISPFKKACFFSLLFHGILLVLFFFVFPTLKTLPFRVERAPSFLHVEVVKPGYKPFSTDLPREITPPPIKQAPPTQAAPLPPKIEKEEKLIFSKKEEPTKKEMTKENKKEEEKTQKKEGVKKEAPKQRIEPVLQRKENKEPAKTKKEILVAKHSNSPTQSAPKQAKTPKENALALKPGRGNEQEKEAARKRSLALIRSMVEEENKGAGEPITFDEEYAHCVKEQVLSHWKIAPDTALPQNEAIFLVIVDQEGRILDLKLKSSSGNVNFDRAAEHAIIKGASCPLTETFLNQGIEKVALLLHFP